MIESLKQILANEVMYYVIVPVILLLFGWVKSWYDIRIQNKKIGYWKAKVRRERSFYNIAIGAYKCMLFNFMFMEIIEIVFSKIIGKAKSILYIGIIYVIINAIIIMFIIRRPTTKMELWTKKEIKYSLLITIFLYLILYFLWK